MNIIDKDIIFNSKDHTFPIEKGDHKIDIFKTEFPTILKNVHVTFFEPYGCRFLINVRLSPDGCINEPNLMLLHFVGDKNTYELDISGMPRYLPANAVFYIKKGEFNLNVNLRMIFSINENVPFQHKLNF